MAGLLAGGCTILGIPRHRWLWWVGPVLIAYAMGTGLKASAVRATIMTLFVFGGLAGGRKPDLPSALGGSALCILVWCPEQIVRPGFILSFVVVSGILSFYPVFLHPVTRWCAPDPFRLQNEPGALRWWKTCLRYIASLAAMSAACWLVASPVIAQWFNVLSPVAVVGNLLVVPGAFLVVLTGCLSMLTGAIHPWAAEVFNHANRWFVDVLLMVVNGLAVVPNGSRLIPSPGWGWIIAWDGLLIGWLMLPRSRRAWMAIPLGVALLVWVIGYPFARPFQVHLLCVDQGIAVHIDEGGRRQVLIDPGPASGAYALQRHLRKQGVESIDELIVTGRAVSQQYATTILMESVAIRRLWVPPDRSLRRFLKPALEG